MRDLAVTMSLTHCTEILGDHLPDRALCPSAKHYKTTHYNLRNMYGLTEAIATDRYTHGTRGLAAHWLCCTVHYTLSENVSSV